MKKFSPFMWIPCLLALIVIGCATGSLYNPGAYTGTGQGHGGVIEVLVQVTNESIESIEVVQSSESDFTKSPINTIIEQAIATNGGTIDAVAGATKTSSGLITAIQSALVQAKVSDKVSNTAKATTMAVEDTETDVVIIGAGGAGLSAAKAAAQAGARVIVLEKMPFVGGNTNYATGGLNAAYTAQQKALGIDDSVEQFYQDTMAGGKDKNNPSLVDTLTAKSAETVDWLVSLGADLSDVGRMGGSTNNRTHRPTGGAGVGGHVVEVLNEAALAVADIRVNSTVTAITSASGAVTGVMVQTPAGEYHIAAQAVIIATGGFGANQEKVVEFKPELAEFGTTNHPGATGDALDLVAGLNVALVDMAEIQTHPTVVPVKNKMITEAVRGNGAILVNRDAKRFVSELETRDVVSAAELEQKGQTAFLLFDQGVRESLSAIESYAKAGLLTQADSLAELAELMGLDRAMLADTVATYNGYVVNGTDPDFNRTNLPRTLETAPYYMVEVGPAVHHTMGGLLIDDTTRVFDVNGNWVSGLFAAGEVTGGVHGANRLGGNAMADITVFGKIAGEQAAEYVAQ